MSLLPSLEELCRLTAAGLFAAVQDAAVQRRLDMSEVVLECASRLACTNNTNLARRSMR